MRLENESVIPPEQPGCLKLPVWMVWTLDKEADEKWKRRIYWRNHTKMNEGRMWTS